VAAVLGLEEVDFRVVLDAEHADLFREQVHATVSIG
jgi:hypothetical protein